VTSFGLDGKGNVYSLAEGQVLVNGSKTGGLKWDPSKPLVLGPESREEDAQLAIIERRPDCLFLRDAKVTAHRLHIRPDVAGDRLLGHSIEVQPQNFFDLEHPTLANRH
jgi:hypothetical protein